VLLHGQIHTIDAHDSVAQAVAIKDGRIVYVGGDAGAKAFTGPATRTIDLNGGVVMPGLIDAHMHPLEGGSGLLACDLQYKRLTVPEFQAALSACAAKEGAGHDGKWLIAVHWFQQEMQPLGIEMTKAMLDALPTTRPVAVFSSFGHSALVNSRGLALAGIDAKTPDPVGAASTTMPRARPPACWKMPRKTWCASTCPRPRRTTTWWPRARRWRPWRRRA
jgi:predicted amidohydrolase YtcJ